MAVNVLTADNFEQEVLGSDIPVLVDFWASWCGPCRMVSPVVDEIAEEFEGKLKVGKVNIDEEGSLASEYGVMSIPTLLLFREGKVAATTVGARPKQDIIAQLGI